MDSPELSLRFGIIQAKVREVVQVTGSYAYHLRGQEWTAQSRKKGSLHSSCTIYFSDIMLDPGWYGCGGLVWVTPPTAQSIYGRSWTEVHCVTSCDVERVGPLMEELTHAVEVEKPQGYHTKIKSGGPDQCLH